MPRPTWAASSITASSPFGSRWAEPNCSAPTAYRNLEETGVFFVVADLHIKYRRPVLYDEPLQLETTCSNVTVAKVEHSYRLLRARDGLLLAEGSSVLACIGADRKVRRIPEFMYPEQP
jgi:acyl-CoA thioester hydrolase